mgnify:FL=1
MIEIHGPTYKYKGEILTKPEIIFIADHHYDETEHCFHTQKLLENSTCDPHLHTIIFDHVNHADSLSNYNCVHFPIFLASESKEFKEANIQPMWNQKTHSFNFMINKPRLHREFLLMLIEHFDLKNFKHTLAWRSNKNFASPKIMDTTTNPLYLDIIKSGTEITTPVTDFKFGPEVTMKKGIRNGNFKNAETYKHLLKTTVFEPSCISIITEPVFFEKEALVTEKTIMAILGGTLPIWFGGWKCADSMRSLGFDVFDDIIDHSYEDLEDPIGRCYYAVERNLEVIRDFERTKKFINENQHRLQHNLNLVLSNVCLEECFKQIKNSPETLQIVLLAIMKKFHYNTFEPLLVEWKDFGTTGQGKIHDKTGLV